MPEKTASSNRPEDLRALLVTAAKHLAEHNDEYHHRTPAEFIAQLRSAAMDLPCFGAAAAADEGELADRMQHALKLADAYARTARGAELGDDESLGAATAARSLLAQLLTRDLADAARYRWLKSNKTQACRDDPQLGTFVNVSFLESGTDDLDAAVDAARGAQTVDLLPADAITVNLVRLAGLPKDTARQCEAIVRQLLAARGLIAPEKKTKEVSE